jgi:O-methyltransferase
MRGLLREFKDRTKRFFLNRGYQLDKLHPARLATIVGRRLGYGVYPLSREFPLFPPIMGHDLAILKDPEFQKSIQAVQHHTLLDVARLANLWNLSRMTGPGAVLEVGTFRGGGALHLSNASPDRKLFVFDSFEGFPKLTAGLDDIFGKNWFKDTTEDHVRQLFDPLGRDVTVVKGFFPASAAHLDLGRIAFCHLDVDIYESTKESLAFLVSRLAPRSLILVDDYQRGAHGLDRAVADFLQAQPGFVCFPVFPGQAILFSLDLWGKPNQPVPTL